VDVPVALDVDVAVALELLVELSLDVDVPVALDAAPQEAVVMPGDSPYRPALQGPVHKGDVSAGDAP
jgi:hypothetical protein